MAYGLSFAYVRERSELLAKIFSNVEAAQDNLQASDVFVLRSGHPPMARDMVWLLAMLDSVSFLATRLKAVAVLVTASRLAMIAVPRIILSS
jgi:hypothetical protein